MRRLEILLLASIFSFAILSSLSFALTFFTVGQCSPCEPNNCVCSIEGCSSGILRIYPSSSPTCSGAPKYEYVFSNNEFRWGSASLGTYYFEGFCSDGRITSCTGFTVKTPGTTTTVKQTTTTVKGKCTLDSDCPGQQCVNGICKPKVEQQDYTWVYVLLAVLIVIFVLVFLFFRVFKKKPQKTFEDIYRKWRR
jgi:hypothetical protein